MNGKGFGEYWSDQISYGRSRSCGRALIARVIFEQLSLDIIMITHDRAGMASSVSGDMAAAEVIEEGIWRL